MDGSSGEGPVAYMARTRAYYRALGYDNDYVWAHHADVPFAALPKPLASMRLGLVTTASPPGLANRDARGVRHVWSGKVDPPPGDLFTDNLAWDKESTHTRDRGSYLPVEVAAALATQGRFAALARRFHGVPTEYSQRKTVEEDAPELLKRLREDGADGAILCAL
jgi:D-proline reductase (dithiol) PrdB